MRETTVELCGETVALTLTRTEGGYEVKCGHIRVSTSSYEDADAIYNKLQELTQSGDYS